jgi:hypothetical protein
MRNEVAQPAAQYSRVYPETLRMGSRRKYAPPRPYKFEQLTPGGEIRDEELRAARQEINRLRLALQERDSEIAELKRAAQVGANHD